MTEVRQGPTPRVRCRGVRFNEVSVKRELTEVPQHRQSLIDAMPESLRESLNVSVSVDLKNMKLTTNNWQSPQQPRITNSSFVCSTITQ